MTDPILLLRPLGGSIALWGAFRERLAEEHRVLAFEYPDHGSTRSLADAALRWLDEQRVGRVHVFGISLGGMVATWTAILAPDRIASLTIACAPARGIELTYNGVGRELSLAACLARPRSSIQSALVDRILSVRFRQEHPTMARDLEAIAGPASRRVLTKHALAAMLHDARSELPRLTAPTLVLAADEDDVLGVDPPRALAAQIRGATFEILGPSGHDLTLEQPLLTADRVLAHVQRLPDDDGGGHVTAGGGNAGRASR